MIYNLAQKYVSVLATFFNTFLIVRYLDIGYLGQYAFLAASGTIYSVFVTAGIRSIYLREIVKNRENREAQRVFSVFAEVVPKTTGLITCITFSTFATLISFDTKDAVTVALVGTSLASTQLTSQKVRSHGQNTLAQIIMNIRPIIFTALLLLAGIQGGKVLQTHFHALVITSFVLPAILAYFYWLTRYYDFVFYKVTLNELWQSAKSFVKEMPALIMLAFGQKAITQCDVITVTALLGLDAAGTYRLATQIVTVANASLFPIRSQLVRKYSKFLDEGRAKEAEAVTQQVAKIGIFLYVAILFTELVVIYQAPYLNAIKYNEDFYLSLGVLAFSGLVKAGIPMIDNYIIFQNKSKKGAIVLLGVVICNIVFLLVLIPLLGLPGACTATLLSVLSWRVAVKRFI